MAANYGSSESLVELFKFVRVQISYLLDAAEATCSFDNFFLSFVFYTVCRLLLLMDCAVLLLAAVLMASFAYTTMLETSRPTLCVGMMAQSLLCCSTTLRCRFMETAFLSIAHFGVVELTAPSGFGIP